MHKKASPASKLAMAFFQSIFVLTCLVFLWSLLPFFFIFHIFHTIYKYFTRENVKGKVVLITGASSGIGEQLTYEYARRGAYLAIVARREKLLQKVAIKARQLGAAGVVPVCGDVSNVDDCKRFVEEAVNHFGRLDHLVNNAGIAAKCLLQDPSDLAIFKPVMDINFWGSVYPTYFALPNLKKTKGRIFVNSSSVTFTPMPGMSIYAASKAALIGFYESLRVEIPAEISITIATLGIVDSEITQGKLLTKDEPAAAATAPHKQQSQDKLKQLPVMDSGECAKAIVDAVCRKQRYVTEPKWMLILWTLKSLYPELLEWGIRTAVAANPLFDK